LPAAKEPVTEVREDPKPIPSFNFEHEIQKIRIPVPLSKLVKNEYFKRSLSKLLQSESPQPSIDSINLQDEADPTNHPIFSLDTDLGSSLLHITETPEVPLQIRKMPILNQEIPPPIASVWKMFFDGASSEIGVGAGVIFISPCQETISLSYKMEFETTNNVAEYEALVLGMRAAKEMGIKEMAVFGDTELII
jgi:hypothetical protein